MVNSTVHQIQSKQCTGYWRNLLSKSCRNIFQHTTPENKANKFFLTINSKVKISFCGNRKIPEASCLIMRSETETALFLKKTSSSGFELRQQFTNFKKVPNRSQLMQNTLNLNQRQSLQFCTCHYSFTYSARNIVLLPFK